MNTLGIDTISFIITFSALTKMLNKLGLSISESSRNYLINKYFEEKEIKLNKDRKVWFVEIGNTQNLSGYILIKENDESISLSKKSKKAKSHYVEVIFAGLRQPTKKIDMKTYGVLSYFIKRFNVHYVDVCFDGKNENPIDKKMYYSTVLNDYIGKYSKEKLVGTTFYVNNPSAPSEDADYFIKVMVYDKYIKESRYKSLDDTLRHWKRIEFRLKVNAKLKDTNGLEEYLDDMVRVAKEYFGILTVDDTYYKQQVVLLTDKRTHKGKSL